MATGTEQATQTAQASGERRDKLVAALSTFTEELKDVQAVDELMGLVTGILKGRRRRIEDDAWLAVERLAKRLGKGSPADWFSERLGVVQQAKAGRRTAEYSRNLENTWCWRNPETGGSSLAMGAPPKWVGILRKRGYNDEQLRVMAKDLPGGKPGAAFWVDPVRGHYYRMDRPQPPAAIRRLLKEGRFTMQQMTRPPGAFPNDKGRVEPSELPPPLPGPIEEPAGKTKAAAVAEPAVPRAGGGSSVAAKVAPGGASASSG